MPSSFFREKEALNGIKKSARGVIWQYRLSTWKYRALPDFIIIDDGSHLNNHVITTFKILFPIMSLGGIYVVEDLQTSYWDKVRGKSWDGSKDLNAHHTSMNFFKSLIDGLNYEEFMFDRYTPSYFDKHIVALHFYHNLVFIYKGLNDEGSNILGKRFSEG